MRRSTLLVLAALAVLAALVVAPAASGEAFGSPREHRLDVPILDAAAVWTGDRGILLGGRNASGPQDVTQTFDPATGESRVLSARLPNDTQAAGVSWTGDQAYLFGGAGLTLSQEQVVVDGEVQNVTRIEVDPHDQIVRFDPVTDKLVRHDASLPDEAFGLAAAHADDATYVFGGVNRSEVNGTVRAHNQDWILRFDPQAQDPIERVGTFPVAVRDAEAVTYEGDIYVFGGVVEHGSGDNRSFEPTDAIYRYDPETGNVTKLDATLEDPMRWFSLVQVEDRAYLFGGCLRACDDSAQDQVNAVHRFNFTTGEMDRIHPTLTWGASVATNAFHDGEKAWVLGGGRGPDRYDTVFGNVTRFDPGPTPPSAPLALEAKGTTDGVGLTWDPPVDDGGFGLTGYVVERTRPGAAYSQVATVDPDVTTYTDGGAEPGVNSTYRVRATGPGGTSAPSDTDNATAPTRPPSAPERLEAPGLPDRILVRWSEPASDGGEPVTEYRVYRNGSLHLTTANTSVGDPDVHDNVTYTYEVTAVNAEGEGLPAGPANGTTADNLPPPQDFTARASGDAIELDWSPPDVGSPDRYQIRRGPTPDDLEVLTSTDGTGHIDSNVEEGVPYWYTVAALDTDGDPGIPTRPQRAALLTLPSEPRNLTVETSPGEAVLTWNPPRDDGGAEDVFYNVIRVDPDGDERFLTPDRWDETSWVDGAVAEGSEYNYSVEAVTTAGAGPRAGPWVARIPVENTPPEARLSASDLRPTVGDTVTFDASGSKDAEGTVVEAHFTFGDGGATGWISELNAEHTYTEVGTYEVRLQVRDEHGAESEPATAVVTVSQEEPDGMGDDGNATDGGNLTDDPPADRADGSGPDGGLPVPGPGLAAAASAALAAGLLRRRRPGGRS